MKKVRSYFGFAVSIFFTPTSFFAPTLLLANTSLAPTPPYGGSLSGSFMSTATELTIELEGAYQITPPWALGTSIAHYSRKEVAKTEDQGQSQLRLTSLTTVSFEGFHYFPGVLAGVRAGAQVGFRIAHRDEGRVYGVLGPILGYDLTVIREVSFGIASSLYFASSRRENQFLDLQVLGSLKYWF